MARAATTSDVFNAIAEPQRREILVLLRKGGLIAVDNVLWEGAVLDPEDHTVDTEAIRAFNRKLHTDDRIALSMLTIGDGLTLACKL